MANPLPLTAMGIDLHANIMPLQDLLGTGATSRMNTPGTLSDRNWSWRYEEDDLKNTLAAKLARMVKKANR